MQRESGERLCRMLAFSFCRYHSAGVPRAVGSGWWVAEQPAGWSAASPVELRS